METHRRSCLGLLFVEQLPLMVAGVPLSPGCGAAALLVAIALIASACASFALR